MLPADDASAVVWVARELREEHRQALDWLNQHTNENLDFFGVVVQTLQIDNSRPAYAFRPVRFGQLRFRTNGNSLGQPRDKGSRSLASTASND